MTRLILLILLLTVVYSWEEFKYVLVVIWSKLRKQKQNYQINPEADVLVSDIVLIATIPASLAYLILNSASLPLKLLVLLGEFIFLGLIIKGVEQYAARRRFTRHYEGADKAIAVIYSLSGLVSPSWNFVSQTARSTSRLGKYLFAFALPLATGLALTIAVHKLGMDEFTDRLDQLTAIAVLALTMNVTIEILEQIFKSNRLHLTALMRIVLGIAIIFILGRM
ncbi:MAG: hypothetical protein WDN47_03365 [Candidatus Doudnabacteria bacterium]